MLDIIENRKVIFICIVIVKGMVISIVISGFMSVVMVNVVSTIVSIIMLGGCVFVSGVSFIYISFSVLSVKILVCRSLSISSINGSRIIGWCICVRLLNIFRLAIKAIMFNVNVCNRLIFMMNFLK